MPICYELFRVRTGLNNLRKIPSHKKHFNPNTQNIDCNIPPTISKFFCLTYFFFSLFWTLYHSKFACLIVLIMIAGFSSCLVIMCIYFPILKNAYSGHVNVNFIMRTLVLSISIFCIPSVSTFIFFPDLSNLLIRDGDIHINPGPNKTQVKILFSNINSIGADDGNRFECLKYRVMEEQCNIILLNETGIYSEEKLKEFRIKNFHDPYMLSRLNGRGIMVYVNEVFKLDVRHDLMSQEVNCVWIEVSGLQANCKSLIGTCYRSPSQKPDERKEFFKNLEENIRNVQNQISRNDSIILFGDFNSRNVMFWDEDTSNTAGRELYTLISNLNIQNLVHESTRIKEDTLS